MNSGIKVQANESKTVFAETEEVHVNENVDLNSHNVANEIEPFAGNSEKN